MNELWFEMFNKRWRSIGRDKKGGFIFSCGLKGAAKLLARNIEFMGPAYFEVRFADGDTGPPLAIMGRTGNKLWRWTAPKQERRQRVYGCY